MLVNAEGRGAEGARGCVGALQAFLYRLGAVLALHLQRQPVTSEAESAAGLILTEVAFGHGFRAQEASVAGVGDVVCGGTDLAVRLVVAG